MSKILFFIIVGLLPTSRVMAVDHALSIVTTTTTLSSLLKSVARGRADVTSLLKGPQDPHYIEARPSYIAATRKADLLVSVGLELEDAWLTNVATGARNPKITPNGPGWLTLGSYIKPIEVPTGAVDRSMGDVHREGNPHYYLDPLRVAELLPKIASYLANLDPAGKAVFEAQAQAFEKDLRSQTLAWTERVQRSGVKKVVAYHRTLSYFLSAFGLESVGYLEPKPGIPPTAKHLIELSQIIQTHGVRCILVESFFDAAPAETLGQKHRITVKRVATEVDALPQTGTYVELIDQLVRAVETCK